MFELKGVLNIVHLFCIMKCNEKMEIVHYFYCFIQRRHQILPPWPSQGDISSTDTSLEELEFLHSNLNVHHLHAPIYDINCKEFVLCKSSSAPVLLSFSEVSLVSHGSCSLYFNFENFPTW